MSEKYAAGIPLQTIIAVGVIIAGGLGAFFELRGDVRVMGASVETVGRDIAEIKKDMTAIKAALAASARNNYGWKGEPSTAFP